MILYKERIPGYSYEVLAFLCSFVLIAVAFFSFKQDYSLIKFGVPIISLIGFLLIVKYTKGFAFFVYKEKILLYSTIMLRGEIKHTVNIGIEEIKNSKIISLKEAVSISKIEPGSIFLRFFRSVPMGVLLELNNNRKLFISSKNPESFLQAIRLMSKF